MWISMWLFISWRANMLQLIVDNKVIETNRVQFSDGCISYDLKDFPTDTNKVLIKVDPSYKVSGLADELNQLLPTLFYLTENIDLEIELFLPYMPYARQDRRFSDNGNSGLSYFINGLYCNQIRKITTVDPHNESALRNLCYLDDINLEYMTQLQAFREVVKREHLTPQIEWDIIIAPDKGAREKAQTIADYYGLPLVCCTKERDVLTGKLSNPVINGDVSGKKVLIVDDLLDNGGTYIQLAQELYKQGAEFTDLYVTHLIAAKGLNVLTNSIHKLYTYHTCCGYVTMTDVQKFNKGE